MFMKKIIAINGSYRNHGITDQTLDAFAREAQNLGVNFEIILLRDQQIQFCTNCRACTQDQGETPGHCVINDAMTEIIPKIEQADGFILASPTNFYTSTALLKRFLERLVIYAYWPWEMNSPKYRKAGIQKKKAIIVSSCAAPGFLGRFFFGTNKQLKIAAETIGAKTVGSIFTGLVGKEVQPKIGRSVQNKVKKLLPKVIE